VLLRWHLSFFADLLRTSRLCGLIVLLKVEWKEELSQTIYALTMLYIFLHHLLMLPKLRLSISSEVGWHDTELFQSIISLVGLLFWGFDLVIVIDFCNEEDSILFNNAAKSDLTALLELPTLGCITL
jgi:hypothetical protein